MPQNNPRLGIVFVVAGVFAISLNDMLIKSLSGGYPLHQIVFTRSAIALVVTVFILQFEGGFAALRTRHPFQHLLRGLLTVTANMTFFVALASLPLATATALFFAAPLMITLLSIPMLGERVGPMRLGAVAVGFAGVLIMQRPWAEAMDVPRIVLLLPLIAALTYALNQMLTRKLGANSPPSALAMYIQGTFIFVSLGFFLIAGDGRFAEGSDNASLQFLFREWIWPARSDMPELVGVGLITSIVGYCLSQAYRIADAATVAPFEYVGLPLAVLWGWLIFGDLPGLPVWVGIALILGSGLFVYLRERARNIRPRPPRR